MIDNWIDLRTDDGRLYGRVHRETWQLEIARGQRQVRFDLIATIRDGQAVAEQIDRMVDDKTKTGLS